LSITGAGKLELISSDGTQYKATSPLSYNDGSWPCAEAKFLSSTVRELWVGDDEDSLILVATSSNSVPFNSSELNRLSFGARDLGTSTALYYTGKLSSQTVGEVTNRLRTFPARQTSADILVILGDSNTADDAHTSVATYKYAEYMSDNTPAGLTTTNKLQQSGTRRQSRLSRIIKHFWMPFFFGDGKLLLLLIMGGLR